MTFEYVTQTPKPKCYDELSRLEDEDWASLMLLLAHETEPKLDEESKKRLRALDLLTEEGKLTEDGWLAIHYQQDFTAPWDYTKDGKVWKSCAVVAGDGNENDVLLHACGPAIDWHIEQYGADCKELGLGVPGPGVWVWEGSMGAVRIDSIEYGTDWDHEVNGDWRQPTQEEWDKIKENECPWTKENLPKWADDE